MKPSTKVAQLHDKPNCIRLNQEIIHGNAIFRHEWFDFANETVGFKCQRKEKVLKKRWFQAQGA